MLAKAVTKLDNKTAIASRQFWIGILHFFDADCIADKSLFAPSRPLGTPCASLSLPNDAVQRFDGIRRVDGLAESGG